MKIRLPKLKINLSRFMNMKTVLVVVIGLFIATVGIVYFSKTRGASAAWFDDSFSYRKKVTISNAGTAQTEFQVAVTFDTATPIAASKMQGDCDDIRVTAENGELLPHWIEEGSAPCDNASTSIWVKMSSIPVGDSNIYVYYGNSSATTGMSGNKVFPFFDDFNGGVLDTVKWSTTGSASVSAGALTTTTGSVYTNNPILSTAQGYMYEQRVQWTTTSGSYAGMEIADDQSTGGSNSQSDQLIYLMVDGGDYGVTSWAADGTTDAYNIVGNIVEYTATASTYHISGFSLSGSSVAFFNNRSQTNSYAGTWTQAPYMWFGYFTGSTAGTSNGQDMTTDWVLARKFATTAPSAGAAGSEETTSGPIGYWKFDEGQGSTAENSTQNNLDGTLPGGTNTPTWTKDDQCLNGKCLFFDGTNDYVKVTNTNSQLSLTRITASAWIRIGDTSVGSQRILYKNRLGTGSDNDDNYSLYLSTTGIPVFIMENSADGTDFTVTAKTNVVDNKWHHIAASYDGTDLKIYVDGKHEGTYNAGSFTPYTGSGPLQIGSNSISNHGSITYTKGFIDEVKIYPYARTAAEIKQDYAARGSVHGVSAQFGDNDLGQTLSKGLVGYWKMDETTWNGANAVLDSSGNLNSGTAVGNATVGSGKFGNGGSFDGTNDYVEVSDNTSLDVSTAVTMSAWVKANALGTRIIDKTTAGDDDGYLMDTYTSKIRICAVGGCDSGNTTLSTGVWFHMALAFDGTTTRFYLNGQPDGVGTDITSIATNALTLRLGIDHSSGNDFNGTMDEVRIYNRALSPSEVSQLYNFAPAPVHYYDFEENTGTTSVVDKSGSGNTGTIYGSMTESDWVPGKFGSALEFDNSDDYISAGTGPTTQITGDQVTMTAWIKPNTVSGNDAIIAKGKSGVMSYMLLRLASNIYMEVNTGTNSTLQGTKTLVTNKWQHVAAVYDGTNKLLYVDGVLDNSGALTGNILANTGPFSFAKRDGQSEWFGGTMDEVKVYNYARTQKQIIQDMNAGHPSVGSPVGSPLVHLKFDEGYGSTANDSSVQGNDGALSAGASQPTWTNNGKFGKALSFDGGDGVLLASTSSLTFTTASNYTVSSWIKTSSSATQQIFSQQRCNSGVIQLYMASGNISWRIVDNAANALIITSPLTYNDDTWHHVLGVRDTAEDKIILYVDGVRVVDGTDPTVTDITPATTENWIGKRYPCALTDNFTGNIDEFKIYGSALTADEVKVEYNHGKAIVLGAGSTGVGNTSADSASREYCPPGETGTCRAPAAEWLMDENTGTTTTYDTSDNENNGTLRDSPSWIPGLKSSALEFDGTNDYVQIGDITTFDGLTEMTISAWVKPDSVPTSTNIETIVGKGSYASVAENAYFIRLRGTENLRAHFSDGTNQIICTAAMPSLNIWTHIVSVLNTDDSCTVYYNGIGVGSSANSSFTSITNNSRVLKIAASDYTSEQYYDGAIDQVRIYDYARTPAQIAWEYNKGAPIAHYKLDECEGTTAYNSVRTFNDAPAGNNGTIVSGTTGSNTSAGTCSSGTSTEMWNNGTTGKRNASLDFDGTNDYVWMADNDIFSPAQFSIAAWVNRAGSSGQDVIAGKGNEYWISYNHTDTNCTASRLGFAVYNGSSWVCASHTAASSTSTWYHMVGVYNGSTLSLYINGQLNSTASQTAPSNQTSIFGIGSTPAGPTAYPFDGQIDNVQFYNYALTPAQVKSEYNAGAVRFE